MLIFVMTKSRYITMISRDITRMWKTAQKNRIHGTTKCLRTVPDKTPCIVYPICSLGSCVPSLLLFLFFSDQGTKFTKVSMTSRGSVRSHSVRHSGYGKVVDDEKEGLPNYTQVVSVLVQMQARNVTTHLQEWQGAGICFDTSKAFNL